MFLLSKSSGLQKSTPPLPTPSTQSCAVCRGWGRGGSFLPPTAALVMAMKQCGLGLKKNVIRGKVRYHYKNFFENG
jgi:hypothetical protein